MPGESKRPDEIRVAASERSAHEALPASEERLRLIADGLPVMVWATDVSGRIEFVNRAYCEFFGKTLEEVQSQGWQPLIHPEDVAGYAGEYVACLRDKKPFHAVARVKRADGQWRWVESFGSPRFSASGEFLGCVGSSPDITDRRRAEEALRESEARYRNIFDMTSDGVWINNLDGRILEVNDAYCHMSGYSHDEIVGMPISILEAKESPHDIREHIKKVLATGGHDRFESTHRRKDGTLFHVEITATYLERERQLAIFVRDITERKRLEEEREHHLAEIKEANQAKDLFFNTLSHELRTPLAAMLNSVEVLKNPESSTVDRTRVIGVMERNIRHQHRLIDDLLDLSRIMRGKVEIAQEALDLREITAAQVEAAEPAARNAGISLSVEVTDQPLPVVGDAIRLGQVISNLLSNAIKFTEAGGSITVRAGRENGYAVVSVRDTGIGISAELLGHLFEPFWQGNVSLVRSKIGLGIGLAVARSLTELHGGTIEAVSGGLGQGSEFSVRLPLRRSEKVAARDTRHPSKQVRSKRVLLVEDNPDLRETVALVLQLLGHTVISTERGREAVEIAGHEKLDVALIDIGLPDIDGYQVATRLREQDGSGSLRLVALTGYATPEHRRRAMQAGFHHHLAKPVDAEGLQRVLGDDEDRDPGATAG